MGLFDGMPKEVLAGMLNEQAEKDYSDLWFTFSLLSIATLAGETLPENLMKKRQMTIDGIMTHLVVHVEKLREEVITLRAEIIRPRKDMMPKENGDADAKEL